MLKRKLGKRIVAGITALSMMATASATAIATLTASAGGQLGEGTFETGVGLPWHICENGTGSMAFTIDDGIYSIAIKNPGGASNGGEDRWDCQFRHRGLSLEYGNTYRITYSVYATNAGKLYAKIGDITNDDCEYWHSNGDRLSMTYTAGLTLDELESKLTSASKTGTRDEYWNWASVDVPAKTWTTFAYEFTLDKSLINNTTPPTSIDGTGEWTFHFGGDGQFTPSIMFPEGTILKFDNLALVDMSSNVNDYVDEPEAEKTGLALNQVGYYPNLNKVATLTVDEGDSTAKDFTVYDSAGKAVYTGKSQGYGYDEGAWSYYQLLDFSDLTTVGEGYYVVCDGKTSTTFAIGDDVYDGLLTDAINYYYLNRSGVAIEEAYVANSGQNDSKSALSRAAGHNPDTAYIADEWVYIYESDPCGSKYSTTMDVTGGWYDAGDYGKYVVNGGVSMWTLANIYERDAVEGDIESTKWADGSGTVIVPEAGNGTPDILDELMWEADFFLKMQRDDGMVYHKIHDYKWTALGVMPYLEAGTDEKTAATVFPSRIVKPATYAATLNAAAAWAQLSRLLEDYNSTKAAEYLAAAEKAYAVAKSEYESKYGDIYAEVIGDFEQDDKFAPLTQNKGGGPYGDTNVDDEFYWAACELYITTGSSSYYDDVKAYPEAFDVVTALVGGENKGTCSSWTWGTLASLGTLSLALHRDEVLTTAEATQVEESILAAGDFYLQVESESGYGTSYRGMTYDATVTRFSGDTYADETVSLENGYEWGSNSMVANNAIVLAIAYDINGDTDYINGVTTALDYLLGRNPMENSYVTGYGTNTTENPHHRYWCHQLKNDWPYAPNGCLSGGPNSNMEDPMIQGAGYKIGELAPMKCYYDQVEAWSVNEITINWNAPMVWLSSFVEDEAPLVGEEETDVLYGDVDCNGAVEILDVITLSQCLMGADSLSVQGAKNADVDVNGSVNSTDTLNIMKYLVKLIDSLPV